MSEVSGFVEFALLAARLLLSAVFLVAGATKLVDRGGSVRALRGFGVPLWLTEPFGIVLPALELLIAGALLPLRLAWYGASGALLLLLVFWAATALNLVRGRKPDCHCFGRLYSTPVGWPTLIRTGLLALCAGWLVTSGSLHQGPGVWASITALHDRGRRVAIVLGCVACFVFFRIVDLARPRSEPVAGPPVAGPPDEAQPEKPFVPRLRPAQRPMNPVPERIFPRGIGLDIGTSAPEFELPGITGQNHTLRSLREKGRPVLLLFTSPYCESCGAMLPSVFQWIREYEQTLCFVLISRGTVQENIAKVKGLEISEVLLQKDFEVAESYDCASTPAAVLIHMDGTIGSALATGASAIGQLVAGIANGLNL